MLFPPEARQDQPGLVRGQVPGLAVEGLGHDIPGDRPGRFVRYDVLDPLVILEEDIAESHPRQIPGLGCLSGRNGQTERLIFKPSVFEDTGSGHAVELHDMLAARILIPAHLFAGLRSSDLTEPPGQVSERPFLSLSLSSSEPTLYRTSGGSF